MSYVYVLKSLDGTDIYIGFSNDLTRRMTEHERHEHPRWRLVYYEAYQSESDARRRERRLKDHGNAIRQLKQRIKDSWDDHSS
jgi:predicted GIY-YIG superfamily endonuclease